MKVYPKLTKEEYLAQRNPIPAHVLCEELEQAIINLPYSDREYHSQEVVKMNKVRIQYGERIILNDLDWTVNNGERWALSGQNGAGKSTLLSLVCADIRRATPATLPSSAILVAVARASGISRSISAMYLQSFTVPISVICQPSASWRAALPILWVST